MVTPTKNQKPKNKDEDRARRSNSSGK